MTSTKLQDIGTAVFVTAAAVNLTTLLITSGINAESVNAAIDASQGGTADASDYLTVLTVALSAAPLIAAMLASVAVATLDRAGPAQQRIWLVIGIWGVAGVLSAGFDPETISTQIMEALQHGPGPLPMRLFAAGVALTTAPYSGLLLVQAVVVSGCTLASIAVLAPRWERARAGGR
jgi:hypothetical protein